MIEQILLQAVGQNLSEQVIPVIVPPVQTAVTTTTQPVVDIVDSILARTETFFGLLIIILSSPGVIALANYFKRGKQRQAGEELLGYLALQVKDIRKEQGPYTQFIYNMLPDEQKKIVDNKFGPVVQTASDKLDNLNDELGKLSPKLAPSTRAAMVSV